MRRLAGPPARRDRARASTRVLPVIGSKELIASLPAHLGLGPGDLVVYPALAYPTYEVGAALAGARVGRHRLADLARAPRSRPCSGSTRRPTRPGGCCRSSTCARWSTGAASAAALLVSDECYLECAWEGEPPVSVLHPDVCGGSHEGILAVHSLSKRSNLAGYRCAFVAGDPALVGELLAVRKNLGLQMPAPAAGRDGGGAGRRRARRRAARAVRRPPGQAARGARPQPASGSTTPRRRSTCGRPATRTAGRPSPGWPTAASWSPPARSTVRRRCPARPGGVHRHRRAGRRRRRPAGTRSADGAVGRRRGGGGVGVDGDLGARRGAAGPRTAATLLIRMSGVLALLAVPAGRRARPRRRRRPVSQWPVDEHLDRAGCSPWPGPSAVPMV